MKHVPNDKFSTDEMVGYSTSQDFKYKKLHSVDCITDYHIEYFDKGQMAVKVWGYPFYKGRYSEAVKIEKDIFDPRMNAAQKEVASEKAAESALKR